MAVWEDTGASEFRIAVHSCATELFARRFDLLAIDIPIGLCVSEPRPADALARRHLSPRRHSSVFPTPARAALNAHDYRHACDVNFAINGKRVSRQAFAIFPKISQVDAALRDDPRLREKVFEIHPEVSFSFMAGGEALQHPKRTASGKAERQALIADAFHGGLFSKLRETVSRAQCADDDIADAVAALWTARRLLGSRAGSFPDPPGRDETGLTAAIWY